jgi:hypothetical protein
MNSRKTLHVIGSMDPVSGGPCQGLRNSIPSLLENGFENEVVAFDSPASANPTLDVVPVHRLGPADNPWRYSAQFHPWMLANLPKFNIVLIHGLINEFYRVMVLISSPLPAVRCIDQVLGFQVLLGYLSCAV